MSSEQGGKPKPGGRTRIDLGSAATLPSDPELAASADTVAVPSKESEASLPRVARGGGEILGNRYEILGELGRGGEGVVYRALDLKADAVVALKFFQQEAGGSRRLDRLRRELQMARKVTHPNVVRIHDLVELPGRFGLSMELVEGEPLDVRLERGPLPRDTLERLALDVARALEAAHAAGVTHRDLKPANVLLRARDGQAMVTDFGVSRLHKALDVSATLPSEAPVKLTREGALIGTPRYMAPEQLEGRTDIGPAADVFAWGALVHEAATGSPLHDATTLDGLRAQKRGPAAAPLRQKRPDLPARLAGAVDRSLARDPADRFANGAELVEALTATRPSRVGPRLLALLAVPAIALGALALVARGRGSAPATGTRSTGEPPPAPPGLRVGDVRRFTFGNGCEEFPSFTPDGQAVVYDGTVGKDSFTYVLGVAPGSRPRQVTTGHGWDVAPRVSPDVQRLAYLHFEPDGTVAAYVASLDGQQPAVRLAYTDSRPSWSRDGRGVWVVEGTRLVEHDARTGDVLRALETGRSDLVAAMTRELTGGDVAVLLGRKGEANYDGLAIASASGLRVLAQAPFSEVLAQVPGDQALLVSRPTTAGGRELATLPLDGGPAAALHVADVAPQNGLDVSPDGSKVVWSSCMATARLSVVGADAGALPGLLADVYPDTVRLSAVPASSDLAMVSNRGGRYAVWIVDAAGEGTELRLPDGLAPTGAVAFAPDGQTFVVAASSGGIHVGSLGAGANVRTLTHGVDDESPAFREGGAKVVFTRHGAAGTQVMQIPAGGGAEEPLLEPGSRAASPSAADDRIAYLAGELGRPAVMLWDGKTGARRELSPALPIGPHYSGLRFSPDGRRVALVRGQEELLEVDAATGAPVRSWRPAGGEAVDSPAYTRLGLVVNVSSWRGGLWIATAAW